MLKIPTISVNFQGSIFEFLEETYTETSLLPEDKLKRAKVFIADLDPNC